MAEDTNVPGPLALGLDALDREHQGQAEHMERLERAIESGRPDDEVRDLVENLVQYLEAHFASEQIAMRESAYAAYEDHVREHDDSMDRLRGLVDVDRDQRTMALVELRETLVRHVHTSDAAFVGFLKQKNP